MFPCFNGNETGESCFFFQRENAELPEIISDYKEGLEREGIRMEIICGCRKHYLLLVYRPDMLQEYLAQDEARNLLLQDGYNIDGSLDEMIVRLKERFFHKTEFPHEIGLFLGYPIEDVKGFRKFGGSGCKMCGYWKVYDDVEQARRIFDSYDKCREFTAAQIRAGYSILQVVGMKHLCTSQMCV